MAHAHCMLDPYDYTHTHTHTHTIFKTYCFSFATMAARTCLSVMFVGTLVILFFRGPYKA